MDDDSPRDDGLHGQRAPGLHLDADADGLGDCDEIEFVTDPELADSDGDGFDDADELECGSDPIDVDDACYACGWGHGDPGDLVGTGNDEGDTLHNLELVDQCGETVPMWDFAGEYHILFLTAAW
ncbi:MAG: hypothetical protein GY884_10295 [Proteobacteria bacterium]|nr:hypothetical protein [Pseudomonadota bacterium]